MENAQSKGWRERFDKQFDTLTFVQSSFNIQDFDEYKDIKSFFQTELDNARADERKRLMRVAEQNWTKSGERNLTDLDALRAAAIIDQPNQEKI